MKWWDNFKLSLKFFFQAIGTLNSKFQNAKKLSVLERLNTADPQNVNSLIAELRRLEENKERGAFVRSHSVIQVEDESPGKFFFKIERHQEQKTMINALRKDDSTTIIDPAEIKQEVAEHFKQRWNCTSTLSASSLEQYLADILTITESYEYTPIDSLITKDEIKLAINSLNPNTSPGSDGLTSKFYQTFQTQLIPTLHQMYNNMFIQQQAPSSHKTAIVKLIPKPGKSTDIRNWRPISLLNCDYKILAKIITFRLLPFLENYISQTQQAAIKGRQLHNVLLNIKSAIDYVNDISNPLA